MQRSQMLHDFSDFFVYFVTAIMKHLVWPAVSNASDSHVQKLGATPPLLKSWGASCPPPGSRVPDILFSFLL